jgi:hypothetical protein
LFLKVKVEATLFCIECKLKLCQECKDYHYSKLKTTHTENSFTKVEEVKTTKIHCLKHINKGLKFLCMDCEELICIECLINSHNTHQKIKYSDAEEKIKEINKKNVQEIDFKLNSYQNCINKCDENEKNFEKQIMIIEEKKNKNKLEKKDFLFQYQKILNFKTIVEEKPIQFMLEFNKNIKNKIIYGFGKNEKYNLGLNDIYNRNEPTKLNFFEKMEIKNIILGSIFSIIILSNNFF